MKKKSYRRSLFGLCFAVAYVAVLPLCHADTYTWKGGSGNWSDPAKWTGGAENTYPGHSLDDIAKIPVNTEPITITIDVTTVLTQLQFSADSEMVSKPVTLSGDGSLTLTADAASSVHTSFSMQANRKCVLKTSIDLRRICLTVGSSLVVDDAGSLYHRSSIYVYGNMTINGGNVNTESLGSTTIYQTGRMIQNGGNLYTRLDVNGGGSFIQNGGTFHNRFRSDTTIEDDAEFVLNGGTFRQSGAWTTNCIDWASRIYPVKKGSVSDIKYYSGSGSYTKYFNPFGQANVDYQIANDDDSPAFTNDYPFAGALMCTNSTSQSGVYPCFLLNSAKATIGRPGGAVVCNSMTILGATSEVDFRLSKIVLQNSFAIKNDGTRINFPNGIEFGAFGGNWKMTSRNMTSQNPASVNLWGDCVIDTTDYLDGTTPREIGLNNIFAGLNRSSLKVKGNGIAKVNLGTKGYDMFRSIDVQEGSTLDLDRYSSLDKTRTVLANELVLGRNSKLKIYLGRSTIDAVRSKIDSTAKIHVTILSGTTAARKILVASLGNLETDIDTSNFVIENEGSIIWQLVRSGNTFYLTDGTLAQLPTPVVEKRSRWTGSAGSSLWSESGNWDNGVPKETSTYVDFYDSGNWHIENDIEGLNLWLLYFQKAGAGSTDCGPYILSGEKIVINCGNSMYNTGTMRFPVIINNPLERTEGNDKYFNASADDDNSITLAGGLNLPGERNSHISVNGDWRFGGMVSARALISGAVPMDRVRPHRYTILPGAKFTVSSQGKYTNNCTRTFRYNIERTGLLEFTGGTSLDFPPSFDETYHTVYGTLDIGIPLKFGADQHFHGTGDVKVHSVSDFAGAKARVHLSGGVTLKPAAWSTATEADGVTAITVDGAATIEPTANLAYGTSSAAVTSTAAERALEITDAGDLTLVANEGRKIVFADPILGEGKLAICGSGTISLSGGVSVGELVFSGSPKIEVGSENPIEVASAVSLSGVELAVSSPSAPDGWTTVVSAPEISGMPTVASNVLASLVTVGDRMELRVKGRRGLLISIQ